MPPVRIDGAALAATHHPQRPLEPVSDPMKSDMVQTQRSGALSPLLALWEALPAYRELAAALAAGESGRRARVVVREAAKAAVLAGLHSQLGRPILIVAADATRAQERYEDLLAWSAASSRVLLFPAFDALPYEQLPVPADVLTRRVEVLIALSAADGSQPPPLIVTSPAALASWLPPPSEFGNRVVVLRLGEELAPSTLLTALEAGGFTRSPLVEVPGQYSQRGGIVDFFPPSADEPVRVEYFGDEIDSLRSFNPATQRSTDAQDEVVLAPASELTALPVRGRRAAAAVRALDWSGLRPEVKEEWQRQLALLEQGQSFAEAPFFAAYLLEQPATLLDYLRNAVVILDEPEAVIETVEELAARAQELQEKQTASGSLPPSFRAALVEPETLWVDLTDRPHVELAYRAPVPTTDRRLAATEADDSVYNLDAFAPPPSFGGKVQQAVKQVRRLLRGEGRVVLVSQQAARLAELLHETGLVVSPTDRLAEVPPAGTLALVAGTLPEGWQCPALKLSVLSDAEVFGWLRPRRLFQRRRATGEVLLTELQPGDYVVHIDHGIGRYIRLVTLSRQGGEREYLLLQYAGNDRLYVPTDQLDRVDKYVGAADQEPTLHRLGGADWERAKSRVRGSVRDIAKGLLELYSAREIATGHAYPPDSVWQRELEESFPYIETPDQVAAIQAVKEDLEQDKPMDRLVCGDVGFGKTEVAVRAVFKVLMDGKQAAVLASTTVLALQHFQTFRERMQAFPVKVELLSRFRTPKEQAAVLDGLRQGTVDVVVGTHRLIQRDVQFKDLGLIVIDEEQRFGVEQKERLKRLRHHVDVLTLTATPIPRTLHMSLAGMRPMSVIETPPAARLPIKTYVTQTNDDVVRHAILRELDRGGQVYFVHNRVRTIYTAARRLAQLVPEADLVVGHGQMPEDDLEQVMVEFANGQHDVLVCSTIIENGLDIPNVNTIIVNDAAHFGLAQLYQLRGRVGRGAAQAYAYFLYRQQRPLTAQAEARLRTIYETTDLGAGFRIALKDLEIRGAGNLLGAEQSGFMNAVGFDLYVRLLAEAVEELRGKRRLPEQELVIDLPLGSRLPDDYIGDADLKIRLYRRLASVVGLDEVEAMEQEFADRFGPPPPPVVDLLFGLRIRALARSRMLRAVEATDRELIVRTSPFVVTDRLALYKAFGRQAQVRRGVITIPRRPAAAEWQADLLQLLQLLRAVGRRGEDGPAKETTTVDARSLTTERSSLFSELHASARRGAT